MDDPVSSPLTAWSKLAFEAFGLSVLIGASAGSAVLAIAAFVARPGPAALLASGPMVLLGTALSAVPIAVALAIFGLPLSKLLWPWFSAWWLCPLCVTLGVAAAKLMLFSLSWLSGDPHGLLSFDLLIVYGGTSAWAYWAMLRRAAGRAAVSASRARP